MLIYLQCKAMGWATCLMARWPSKAAASRPLARREMMRAQRSVMSELLRDGMISDEVYGETIGKIDAALVEFEQAAESGPVSSEDKPASETS
jgi:hypothetical protein